MKATGNEFYWERACRFFRSTGQADTEGSYFLHNKNARVVKIGVLGPSLCPELPVFKEVEKLVRKEAPCFLLASPDIKRRFTDPSIPLIYTVQPAIEFTFSPERSDGHVSYASDSARARQGESMLRAAGEQTRSTLPDASAELRGFFELIAGWKPAESDDAFLARLIHAISALQDHPSGKLTLTRAYERARAGRQNPFGLYELYAGMAGEYACSHFVCIRRGVFSVGVTPENVFEVSGRKLTVDVVAATCRSNEGAAFVAAELTDHPKQQKEHASSLTNRQNRFRPFCADGSLRVVQDARVKTTRNVSHLHSVFSGELLPQVTVFDLMGSLFPLLGARPNELSAIADAEAAPHRYYGGVVGHTHGEAGGCFLNIRTALFLDDVIHAKVGVGVLGESDAHSELVETRDKLLGLLEAFQLWAPPCPRESGRGVTRIVEVEQ